jgi:hypothetical protein
MTSYFSNFVACLKLIIPGISSSFLDTFEYFFDLGESKDDLWWTNHLLKLIEHPLQRSDMW